MSFARGDSGHWKDKLPYVEHDLAAIAEREEIFRRFGRFDWGFDFGAAVSVVRSANYRSDPAILANNVEPRFRAVGPDSRYSEESGFGWTGAGPREANGIALASFDEMRAVARKPGNLPHDVLFRDSIRGRGAETFRVRTGPGVYTVSYLHPDKTVTTAKVEAAQGFVDVPFGEGEWNVSGLVLQGATAAGERAAGGTAAKRPPGPSFTHSPPLRTAAGKPVVLRLGVSPRGVAGAVRLHYRPLNHLAEFTTMESKEPQPEFTIPAGHVPGEYDLMYYFEVLGSGGKGWFFPDQATATPYFVVSTGDR